ncbi:hypothetical protein F4801DRAFT_567243 [Xylaria longipes]|nr:hypothetical protein F4801DRAFT_567243 [Xylaria longipes]
MSLSSSSSVYSLPSGPRQLHRIAFEGEDTAHWALFLPDTSGSPSGLLVHVGVHKGWSGTKTNHKLRQDRFTVTHSTARTVFPIAHAVVSEYQLLRAAEAVFERKGYRLLTNNCQHFCIDVVTELNRVWPETVPPAAVHEVRSRGTSLTNVVGALRRNRVQHLQADPARHTNQDRRRISID